MAGPEHDKWMVGLNPNLEPMWKRSRGGGEPGVSMALPEEYDYPFPMPADCKIVHGKVKGPPNHALCGKHGHVVDTKTRMVIAKDIAMYIKQGVHMEPLELDKNSKDDATATAVSAAHDQAVKDHEGDLKRYHDVAEAVIVAVTANTTKYSVCVLKACQAFQNYADPLLEDLRKVEAEDLFGPIIEFALKAALGKIGEKIFEGLEEIEKKVAKKVYDVVQGELIKGVQSKLKKKSGVDALKEGVQTMIDQAGIAADHIAKIAEEEIAAPLHDISKTAGARTNLSPEQEKIIKAFVDQDYNAVLEGCGLPSVKTSEAIQLKIYGGLIQKFQERLIVQRRLDAGLDYGDSRAVAYDAKKHVDEAVQARRQKIDQEERVH
jgi:hypothetical protein